MTQNCIDDYIKVTCFPVTGESMEGKIYEHYLLFSKDFGVSCVL